MCKKAIKLSYRKMLIQKQQQKFLYTKHQFIKKPKLDNRCWLLKIHKIICS